VVVVGGGFGGLYAATYLARSELADREATITLVDRKSYFTFTPLLAEVAAGSLGTEHLSYPYRVLGRRYGFHFVRDEVRGIDLDAQVLRTAHSEISFDYLVVALGTEPRYFGNDCVREHSLALTTVNDAVAIRNRVLDCLERAVLSRGADARSRLLTFVVAGAGPAR
jgi:NADH dehydrogenase